MPTDVRDHDDAAAGSEPAPPLVTARGRHEAPRRIRATARAALLSVAAAAAAVFVTLTFSAPASFLLGYQQILITGQSMHPTIAAGDLVYVTATDRLAVGDIATFRVNGHENVTHRVVEIVHPGQRAREVGLGTFDGPSDSGYLLKGDANRTVDPYFYDAGNLVGRVDHTIPKVGYALYYAARYKLTVLLAIGTLACGAWLLRDERHTEGERHDRG